MWLGASRNTAFHVLNATLAFPALAGKAKIRVTQSGLEQKVTEMQRFQFGAAPGSWCAKKSA